MTGKSNTKFCNSNSSDSTLNKTWNLWWVFHWIQLRAAAVQHQWVEANGTLPKVPMPWHPPVLVIAVWDQWWEDWESGTYPIHSGMSRVFYLPQHRTLSTWHPLALPHMRSTGSSRTGVWTRVSSQWIQKPNAITIRPQATISVMLTMLGFPHSKLIN